MWFLDSPDTDPAFNLAVEELLFLEPPAGERTLFRLWRNQPCVVVGRHQNSFAEINAPFLQQRGIQVQRRISGGGAVYHDLGNLNFSWIVSQTTPHGIDYRPYVEPIARALRHLGLPVEFTPRHDLAIGGRKISGNAQHLARDRVLHHGTLLFAANLDDVAAALRPPPGITTSHGVASVRSPVTTIREHLPAPLTLAAFAAALVEQLRRDGLDPRPRPLTAAERAAAHALAESKYRTWEWTHGASPPFTLQRHGTVAGRETCAQLTVRGGRIESCEITPCPDGVDPTALRGGRLEPAELAARLASWPPELARLLGGTDLA